MPKTRKELEDELEEMKKQLKEARIRWLIGLLVAAFQPGLNVLLWNIIEGCKSKFHDYFGSLLW